MQGMRLSGRAGSCRHGPALRRYGHRSRMARHAGALLVSGGRFLFGIGGGWNQEEIENHGTVFATRMQKMREQIEAMKAIWTETKTKYPGDIVDFPAMMIWPKPARKP